MDRWDLSISVEGNTQCLSPISVTLTPAQSGVAITAGAQGIIQEVVTGNLNLISCPCSSVAMLKVTLSSAKYMFTPASVTEASTSLSCRGT